MSKETKAEKDTAKKNGKKAENNTPKNNTPNEENNTPKEENKPAKCGDCKKGKPEQHNGKDVMRCPLRAFLQRANQKACEACE